MILDSAGTPYHDALTALRAVREADRKLVADRGIGRSSEKSRMFRRDIDAILDSARIDAERAAEGETQGSMSDWAQETFGPVGSNVRVAARANEEMAELLRALSSDDAHPKAAEEVADVVIVLNRLATRLGVDLADQINRKMAINRQRIWKKDDTGHGYHVREKTT